MKVSHFFFSPNGSCSISGNNPLSVLLQWVLPVPDVPSSVEPLLSRCLLWPLWLHSAFQTAPSRRQYETEPPRGSPSPHNVFPDAWMWQRLARLRVTLITVWLEKIPRPRRGVSLSVNSASGSHVLTLVISQTLQVKRRCIRSGFIFSLFYTVYLFIFMTRNVRNLRMLWSGVSKRGINTAQ